MAISRAKKKQKVKILSAELATSTTAIIGTFAKMTVAQDFELRKVIRGAGGKYRVLKNKLAAKASEGSQVHEAMKGLKGVSAAAFTSGDPVELAKVFSKWVSDNAEFTFKLGIIDGKLISVDEVKALATMPGKDELFAKLLFLISSPAQRLAAVINATGRNLAVVINEAVKEGKFGVPAVEAASVEAAQVAVAAPVEVAAVEAAPVEAAAAIEIASVETAAPVADPVPVEVAGVEASTPVEVAAPVEVAPVEAAPVHEAAEVEAPAEVEVSAEVVAPVEAVAQVEGTAAEGVVPVEEVKAEEVAAEAVPPVAEV